MIKQSDVFEMRNRLTPQESTITRIAGVYVSVEGKVISAFNKPFMQLSEPEKKKYIEIAKGLWSTDIDNKLLTLEFDNLPVSDDVQYALMDLVRTELKDDLSVMSFARRIIDHYQSERNYLILFFMDSYDVIKKATDGASLDESEETYAYVSCAVMQMAPSKSGLMYRRDLEIIGLMPQEQIVGKTKVGFVWPSFEDRSAEREHLLYYVSDPIKTMSEISVHTLGCRHKATITQIRNRFEKIFLDVIAEGDMAERMLARVNVEFELFMEQERGQEEITVDGLRGILEVSGMEAGPVERVLGEYTRQFPGRKPKIYQVYNPGFARSYHARMRRMEFKDLLEKTVDVLRKHAEDSTAVEIEKSLEKGVVHV